MEKCYFVILLALVGGSMAEKRLDIPTIHLESRQGINIEGNCTGFKEFGEDLYCEVTLPGGKAISVECTNWEDDSCFAENCMTVCSPNPICLAS
jgi:hypothetical protein